MSLPPQVIRVKRKRVDESPVTFLQLDDGAKRHRSGSNWVYQRRDPSAAPQAPSISRDVRPIIQVSSPSGRAGQVSKTQSNNHDDARQPGSPARRIARAKSPSHDTTAPSNKNGEPDSAATPQRRFHMSRKAMAAASASPSSPGPAGAGISKKRKHGAAVFVERNRANSVARKAMQQARSLNAKNVIQQHAPVSDVNGEPAPRDAADKPLKKPGATAKVRPSDMEMPSHAPLPPSLMNRHNQDLDKIAADMNQWVLNEIGANLEDMELERQQADRSKLRPKPPQRRYKERHPQPPDTQQTQALSRGGEGMADEDLYDESDVEGDEDDWIIDEYVRVPLQSMTADFQPSDIGVLVLDNEEESILFFGADDDDDDYLPEDEEDENAENHYTADYPEDEVDSDDEYNRQAYHYRHGFASDDEEFDNDDFDNFDDDSDDMVMDKGSYEEDDMERIRAYMKRNSAFK